jgi:hypothetical protein
MRPRSETRATPRMIPTRGGFITSKETRGRSGVLHVNVGHTRVRAIPISKHVGDSSRASLVVSGLRRHSAFGEFTNEYFSSTTRVGAS